MELLQLFQLHYIFNFCSFSSCQKLINLSCAQAAAGMQLLHVLKSCSKYVAALAALAAQNMYKKICNSFPAKAASSTLLFHVSQLRS
jgi:hypothetical protein